MIANLQPVRDPDAELESRIVDAYKRYMDAANSFDEHAPELWGTFVALVAQRSPERVEQMEQNRGLR